MNGWMEKMDKMLGWMDGWLGGWKNGQDMQIGGWMDG